MRILLTGAGGFLGKALASHWHGQHELELIPGRQDFRERLERCGNCDWLVHAGAEISFRPDTASLERNLASARAVRDFVKAGRAKNLLFLSAAGVAGVGAEPKERGEAELGRTDASFVAYQQTAYIQGKIEAERMFRAAGLPLSVVYPSTVFGPGMNSGTFGSLATGRFAPPGGSSFLAMGDFLSALDFLLRSPAVGEGFLLNGGNLPFREMFLAARGGKKNFAVLPRSLRPCLGLAGAIIGDAILSTAVMASAFGYKYYSAEKFRAAFPWNPEKDFGKIISAARGPGG